jgi:EAL domain-containing protein (putative c-di-GMP-specific phosphodiesterase class I)
VRAVVQLGTALGIATTAVGVETREQLGNLRVDGCTEIQGNLICWAAPAREVPALLRSLGRPVVTAAA